MRTGWTASSRSPSQLRSPVGTAAQAGDQPGAEADSRLELVDIRKFPGCVGLLAGQSQPIEHTDAGLGGDGDVARAAGSLMGQRQPEPSADGPRPVQKRLAALVEIHGGMGGAEGNAGGGAGYGLLRAQGADAFLQNSQRHSA